MLFLGAYGLTCAQILGGVFPLFGLQMYNALGLVGGNGSSLSNDVLDFRANIRAVCLPNPSGSLEPCLPAQSIERTEVSRCILGHLLTPVFLQGLGQQSARLCEFGTLRGACSLLLLW